MEGGQKTGLQLKGTSVAGKEMLKQLARSDPYYKRNRPHICSFFLKGECTRGSDCPYRHEQPPENAASSSAQQSIQDRYHGTSDPVAKRLLTSYADTQGLAPPADTSITSLFLSSLSENATEASVRTAIVQSVPSLDPQKIKSVVHVAKSRCAFANFKDRESAELAAVAWAPGFAVDGQKVTVKWGRSRPAKAPSNDARPAGATTAVAS
jgi:pre-mRNA-splicing factor RBM22/SLT11